MSARPSHRSSIPRQILTGLAHCAFAAGLVVAGAFAARATDVLAGPIPARVIEVVDGDTMTVEARIWLGQRVTTRVRLAGIDTPEMRGDCDAETALADRARRHVVDLLNEQEITLHEVSYGTYAGRVVARVAAGDSSDIAQELLAAGLAQPYGGRGPRPDWCSVATTADE